MAIPLSGCSAGDVRPRPLADRQPWPSRKSAPPRFLDRNGVAQASSRDAQHPAYLFRPKPDRGVPD